MTSEMTFVFSVHRHHQLLLITSEQTDFRDLVVPLVLAEASIGEGVLRRCTIPPYPRE